MAKLIVALRVVWDEPDREAFEREVEAIARKYGNQPHSRRERDAQLERAAMVFASCCRLQGVTADG